MKSGLSHSLIVNVNYLGISYTATKHTFRLTNNFDDISDLALLLSMGISLFLLESDSSTEHNLST